MMLAGVLGGPDGPLLHAAAATAQIPPSNQKQRLRGSRLKRLNRSARPRALEQLSQLRGSKLDDGGAACALQPQALPPTRQHH
mmetsp:Transcript_1933/g.5737  ORF Transcript_1933/g.5737 Transcript_1933/m.5737 type:complete len:83 (+) Transcript_1933:1313-1561(+)